MVKIFRGAGVVTPSNPPPPPTNNFCPYPLPVFRCFCKDPLMIPTSSILHCYLPPHPPPLPPPPKNFDHTLDMKYHGMAGEISSLVEPLNNKFYLLFVNIGKFYWICFQSHSINWWDGCTIKTFIGGRGGGWGGVTVKDI